MENVPRCDSVLQVQSWRGPEAIKDSWCQNITKAMQKNPGETEGSWLPVCMLGWEGDGKAPRMEEEQGGGGKFSYSVLSSTVYCHKWGKNPATPTQLTGYSLYCW